MKKQVHTLRFSHEETGKKIFPHEFIAPDSVLSHNAFIQVVVWNVFKQQREDCLCLLKQYSQESQLILLQEAYISQELLDYALAHQWIADIVPALTIQRSFAGVMTLARAQPYYCYPFLAREPLLRVAKSALISVYALENSLPLMVANIHSVNFSLGVAAYFKQIQALIELLAQHTGPIILAGDFNAWSRRRRYALFKQINAIKLKEVHFDDDHRKAFLGNPLDFIFYRDLVVNHAQVLSSTGSDHNPLLVKFEIPQMGGTEAKLSP